MNLASDHQVMTAVRNGDVGTMGILYERYHQPLFSYFLRLTGSRAVSEDLVHDVFYRMLKYRQTYQAGDRFTAWMYQIARNVHLDHTRKWKLEIVPDEPQSRFLESQPSGEPGPYQKLERGQETLMVRRALAKLPVEKREVLVLSRFQNLKYEEIAQILNCEVGAVKVRVYRAMKQLELIYGELAGEKAS